MMDSLYDLLPDLFIELPNCPEQLIKQHLRLIAREFCRETEAYRIELDPIDIVSGTVEYNLNTGTNGSISRIIWVKKGDNITDANDQTNPLSPGDYYLKDEWTLVLYSEPSSSITDGLIVKVAIRPDFDEDASLPPWFLERYADRLISGVKSKLLRMNNKPWTDRGLAGLYSNEYNSGIIDAKQENFRDYKFQDVMIQSRRFSI